mgnify:CR=1 FL=1
MRRVGWGVIGISGIARRRTVPEMVEASRKAELVAVMSRSRERAEKYGKQFGAKYWYTSLEELLSNPEVEAVYVATPNHLHREHVIMAARAGKHVLCEKPLGRTVDECVEMIRECRRNGVKLGVALMMRFHGLHRKIKELIERGMIGRPVLARAQLTCWYPKIEGAWRQIPELGGGGSLIDMGSHCIDLLETLLSTKVKEVSAFQDTLVQDYEVEDTSAVLLRFENGVIGMVDNCFSIPDKASQNRLEIYGSEGSILAEGSIGQEPTGRGFLYRYPQEAYESEQKRIVEEIGAQEIRYEPVKMYAAEIDHFSECILEDREPEISGEVGLWNMKVISACYESARTKKAVKVV